MKHLIICREYPPAPGGGIGTYVHHMARLFAESGETVHVIGQLWRGAEQALEEQYHGRLIIHRVPCEDWTAFLSPKPRAVLKDRVVRALFNSGYHPQCFSWQASLLAERLIEHEGIDIIEAQEYEAPLYFLQLRRALGLGPKRQPPCLIHLHSPTEFIARYNDWDMGLPAVVTAKRLEDYSIAAADALLAPSHYLARQVEAHYGMLAHTIQVIPYPFGNASTLEREEKIFEQGTICYVGRLERRKGIIEWLDAAVAVAHEYPQAQFEFVGANCLDTDAVSGKDMLKERIPRAVRPRFHFRGAQERRSLPQFMARARMAVVPSRWENFPYACIEAMGSGLPVIASPAGGMAEMIEDGHTGWLAREAGSEGLAEALKRALETSPPKIAAMGRQAAAAIRRLCDNTQIVEHQLDYRSQLVHQGTKRSGHIPVNVSWAGRPLAAQPAHRPIPAKAAEGLAIVVTCFNNGALLQESLLSLEQQTEKPAAVVVVDAGSTEEHTVKALRQARRDGWQLMTTRVGRGGSAKNVGIEAILGTGVQPMGFAFLQAGDRLQPRFVAVGAAILQRCPEVGVVSCWTSHTETPKKVRIKPCPSFPYQWLTNDATPLSTIRTEALCEVGRFRVLQHQDDDAWDLCNAVIATGWAAVTVPEVLGEHCVWHASMPQLTSIGAPKPTSTELLERFPALLARDAHHIALLTGFSRAQLLSEGALAVREQVEVVRMMLRHPGRTAKIAFWVLERLGKRFLP
jgi:glycosyltransferase involved in cell wall biosynthesis